MHCLHQDKGRLRLECPGYGTSFLLSYYLVVVIKYLHHTIIDNTITGNDAHDYKTMQLRTYAATIVKHRLVVVRIVPDNCVVCCI